MIGLKKYYGSVTQGIALLKCYIDKTFLNITLQLTSFICRKINSSSNFYSVDPRYQSKADIKNYGCSAGNPELGFLVFFVCVWFMSTWFGAICY